MANAPNRMAQPKSESAQLIAIAGVILSMGLVAIGNGLMFAYVPIRLGLAG